MGRAVLRISQRPLETNVYEPPGRRRVRTDEESKWLIRGRRQ